MEKKIDLTSTAVEKTIDVARSFLGKLIKPAVEEAGLLVKGEITYLRFKRQVKLLNRSKEYCEKHSISPKAISLKLLCPLLENASLEDDETMQDKWAILLTNLVDSKQNIENHVFPYILSQISSNEFAFIEKECILKKENIYNLRTKLVTLQEEKKNKQNDIEAHLKVFGNNILPDLERKEAQLKKLKLEFSLNFLEREEITIVKKLVLPHKVKSTDIQEFEISNLSRLGLVNLIHETFTETHSIDIPNDPNEKFLNVDFDIFVDLNINYVLTQLGELFIDACTEKKLDS